MHCINDVFSQISRIQSYDSRTNLCDVFYPRQRFLFANNILSNDFIFLREVCNILRRQLNFQIESVFDHNYTRFSVKMGVISGLIFDCRLHTNVVRTAIWTADVHSKKTLLLICDDENFTLEPQLTQRHMHRNIFMDAIA